MSMLWYIHSGQSLIKSSFRVEIMLFELYHSLLPLSFAHYIPAQYLMLVPPQNVYWIEVTGTPLLET